MESGKHGEKRIGREGLVTAPHSAATSVCASHPPADISLQALGMVSCNWETVERLSAWHELGQVPLVCTQPCTEARTLPLHSHLQNSHMFSLRMGLISQVPRFSFLLRLELQISLTSIVNSNCERSAHGDGMLEERTAGRKAHPGFQGVMRATCSTGTCQPLFRTSTAGAAMPSNASTL